MKLHVMIRKVGFILLVGISLSGCNFEFEATFTPLVVPTLPTPMIFTTPGQVTAVPSMEITTVPTVTFGTVEVEPEVVILCTIDALRLREGPTQTANQITLMRPGTEVTATGSEAQAEGYTWYEVEMAEGTIGWSASNWLQEGECSQVFGGADTPTIIERAYIIGYDWMDERSTNHYAIDLYSASGDTTIYSPYTDQVVGSDSCQACLEEDPEEGNTEGMFDLDYNYGYGAMIVVEYTYSDLNEVELQGLFEDGVNLEEGQSLYMMVGHLDPNLDISESGIALVQTDSLASIGDSGNSGGYHAHVEIAINDSGLTPEEDQELVRFWVDDVVERVYGSPIENERRGNRIDPSSIFDIP